MSTKLYSVITGDIINSSRLSVTNKKKIKNIFSDLSKVLKKNFQNAFKYNIDVYRGDGWQLLLNDPVLSLRVALIIRTALRSGLYKISLDSKIAVAVGSVDSISKSRVSQSTGEAFALSGLTLEKLKRVKMGFNINDERIDEHYNLVFAFIDSIFHKLTAKQSFALYGSLIGWDQKTIAKNWIEKPIAQSAVAQHLESASWYVINQALLFYEREIEKVKVK